MNILVTGATGGLGGYVIRALQEMVPKESIFALARDEAKAAPLKEQGIQVRFADYSDKAALVSAFAGIDRLVLISGAPGNRQAEHKNVVDAAKEAGVSFIAYTSLANAAESTSALAVDHAYTEGVIREANIPHTFLRNNWYLENELPLIGSTLSTGTFVHAADAGKVGWALKREYGEAAAKVAANQVTQTEVLELSGTPIDYNQFVVALNEATGKQLAVQSATDQEFVASLVAAQLPEAVAEVFLSFQHDIKDDVLNVSSNDFEAVLGHPLTPLAQGIKELLAE